MSVRFLATAFDASLMLLLLNAMMLMMLSTGGLSGRMHRGLRLSLLLGRKTDGSRMGHVVDCMRMRECAGRVRCVSGRSVLTRRATSLKLSPARFLNCGPCATSVRIGLGTRCTGASDVVPVGGHLVHCARVERVSCPDRLVGGMGRGVHGVDILLLTLTLTLSVVSFTLVGGAVGLAVCSRHFLLRAVGLIKTD